MLFLFSCTNYPIELPKVETKTVESFFSNKGFALIYNDDLYKQKIVSSKLQKRDLLVFQKNLKKNTKVKVTNLFNSKSIIAQVGKKAKYPLFYNSVVSERIASELEINKEEPYIEIIEIVNNSSFVAKTAKTFDEEKNVATKAPIDDIKIKDLSEKKENKKKSSNNQFIYIIKIGDFYFEKSAKEMKKRIVSETSLKNVNIKKITTRNYRVFLGPYKNLNSLKKSFNAISVLEFENLEIIKK
tara:strand:+ start:4644 stop:5369 length:726 start_codon:yes stop_codon:yes gene_type:complete